MMELTDDYLAAESELVALLEDKVGELRKVYTSVDLAELKQRSQVTPAAHVIYWGDTPALAAQGGAIGHVTQTWIVVLAVNLRNKDAAGPLLAQMIKALSGHHVSLGNLVRQGAPKPTFNAGFGYYPLAYEIKFRTKGAKP
ncbi:MAG: hypothetical protein ACK4L8_10955 [Nitrincola lacisaponensis]|uniref:phage tail terminator protein n=1 Tax=Nitrincola lacisaponensis TaxID=267850 RepID=UPI00391C89BE